MSICAKYTFTVNKEQNKNKTKIQKPTLGFASRVPRYCSKRMLRGLKR
jgi:hypothetical protein